MDRFLVPQFTEVEDKIFGPITVRQFIICTIGGLLIFISYKLSDFSLFLLELFIIAGLTIVMAFVKVNGKNFHFFLLDFLDFVFKTKKVAVWKKGEDIGKETETKSAESKKNKYEFYPKKLPISRLTELSLIVDTGGSYTGENDLAELKEKDINFKEKIKNNII